MGPRSVLAGALLLLVGATVACAPEFSKTDPERIYAEGVRYALERAFRREVLERALVDPTNLYAVSRLDNFALPDGSGWDALPVFDVMSEPLTLDDIAEWAATGELPVGAEPERLVPNGVPEDYAALVRLGERTWWGWPVRHDYVLEWAASDPERLDEFGFDVSPYGVVIGMRKMRDAGGQPRIAMSCTLCHCSLDEAGEVALGIPNRRLDLGRLWVAYADWLEFELDAQTRAEYLALGPGRVDVTPDGQHDPLAPPPLRGVRLMHFLHQSGALRHDQVSALAIRIETLMITSATDDVRPPHTAAYALAAWMESIEPLRDPAGLELPGRAEGEVLFEDSGCAACHDPRNDFTSAALVAAEYVGTDPASAASPTRGTGAYRVPTLLGVFAAAPYLHDGSVATLAELLDPARLADDYTGGIRGDGPIPGHPFGLELGPAERAALIDYLKSL